MRVLFTTQPGLGHIQPLIPLALAAHRRGHEVRVATAGTAADMVRAAGLTTLDVGLPEAEMWAQAAAKFGETSALNGFELGLHYAFNTFSNLNSPLIHRDLLERHSGYDADVVVSDPLEFAGPSAALRWGVPFAVHAFGGAIGPDLINVGRASFHAGCAELGLEAALPDAVLGDLYIDLYPPSMQIPDVLAVAARVVGRRPQSISSLDGFTPSQELTAFLDGPGSRLPLVYITFGTVFNINRVFTSAVDVMRRHPELAAIVTVGTNGDPSGFGPLPDNVHVERYVDQQMILPRCAVVISHIGTGTALASLGLGIPQVGLPQSADQYTNALQCAAVGAGMSVIDPADIASLRNFLAIPPHELVLETSATTEVIDQALSRVLSDPSFRAAAERMALEIASMPDLDDVIRHVEDLVG